MQGLATIVGIFAGSIWDVSQNHGAWSRVAVGAVEHALRSIGFL